MSRLNTYIGSSKHLITFPVGGGTLCYKSRFYTHTNIKAFKHMNCPNRHCAACPLAGPTMHFLEPVKLLDS